MTLAVRLAVSPAADSGKTVTLDHTGKPPTLAFTAHFE
jgi:hypothetical protein